MCLLCYLPFLGALGLASLGGGGFLLRLRALGREAGGRPSADASSRGPIPATACRCANPENPKQGAASCR
jgi:hypothetical protein